MPIRSPPLRYLTSGKDNELYEQLREAMSIFDIDHLINDEMDTLYEQSRASTSALDTEGLATAPNDDGERQQSVIDDIYEKRAGLLKELDSVGAPPREPRTADTRPSESCLSSDALEHIGMVNAKLRRDACKRDDYSSLLVALGYWEDELEQQASDNGGPSFTRMVMFRSFVLLALEARRGMMTSSNFENVRAGAISSVIENDWRMIFLLPDRFKERSQHDIVALTEKAWEGAKKTTLRPGTPMDIVKQSDLISKYDTRPYVVEVDEYRSAMLVLLMWVSPGVYRAMLRSKMVPRAEELVRTNLAMFPHMPCEFVSTRCLGVAVDMYYKVATSDWDDDWREFAFDREFKQCFRRSGSDFITYRFAGEGIELAFNSAGLCSAQDIKEDVESFQCAVKTWFDVEESFNYRVLTM